MNRRHFLFPVLLLLLSVFCCVPAFSEEVQITSTFNKRAAQVGEEIRLTIRISGVAGNIQAPRLPPFKGFDTFYTGRASHISFINGQSSSNIEFSYALVAKEAGRHQLQPIEVMVDGRRFATEAVELEITPGANRNAAPSYTSQNAPFNPGAIPTQGKGAPTSSSFPPNVPAPPVTQEPPPNFVPEDDNIFVRAWVDKNSVYPNEQILLSYSLYTRYDTRYEGFEKEAQVSGFWIEDFPMAQDVRRETVHMNGKRYIKADVKMTALFPTTPADYTIDPGTLKASIRKEPESGSAFDDFFNDSFFSGGGFFAQRESRILKPPPINITVKPFPEQGKPKNFQGAVGNFKMSATLDKNSVKQNEPVTLQLVLEGEGNIETLNKPAVPELKNFKIYDADSSAQLFKNGNVVGGRKTFEIVFIPTQAGKQVIPKLEFSFFNPVRAQYQTLNSPEFPIDVAVSDQPIQLPKGLAGSEELKKGIQVEGQDIRYIWEKIPDSRFGFYEGILIKGLTGGNILLALMVVMGLLRQRQEQVFAKDSALKRRKFAKAKAERAMRRLDKKKTSYFEDAEKVLTQYLADKFNFSTHGMTRYDLENQLREALGSDDPLLQDIREFYQVCDESRFGRGEVPEALKEKALRILKETIARVEKMRR